MNMLARLGPFLLMVAALAGLLAALPSQAAPVRNCTGPLHPKSQAGLMPPACERDPKASSLAEAAPPITFLNAPINTSVGSWAQVVASADLTGDRRVEATVGTAQYFDQANDSQLHTFAYQTPETPFLRIQKRPGSRAPEALVSLDVNQDGRNDLVLAASEMDKLAVYTQQGAASESLANPTWLSLPGAPDALAVGDIDGDLHPDLIAVAPTKQRIQMWHSSPKGLVADSHTLPFASQGYDALAVGDINNDGEDDIVALRGTGFTSGSLVVFPQVHGTFPSSYTLSPDIGGYLPNGLAVGDVNGDGRDDIVVTAGGNLPDARLNIFQQNNAGLVATTPITYAALDLPSAVAIADINHDGRDDVIMAHDGWRSLSVRTQKSDGTLNAYAITDIPYSSRYRPNALALGDFNGDGGLDVAVAERDPGLTVLPNAISAPTSTISLPPEATTLMPGKVTVSGLASTTAITVEVRLRGSGEPWQVATLLNGAWQTSLTIPNQDRAWWLEARAIDAAGHVQAPVVQRRIRVTDMCYAVADNDSDTGSSDRLLLFQRATAETVVVGSTSKQHIEAIALKPGQNTLYAADAKQLGKIDVTSGKFTATSKRFGTGSRSGKKVTFDDVDGLAFDPNTSALYGVQRRLNNTDVLFRIDPTTGAYLPGRFDGADYVEITGANLPDNIGDLAIDPDTGSMYGIAYTPGKDGVLVKIDKVKGTATVVGELDVTGMEGLTFAGDDLLYGATNDRQNGRQTQNRLYTIDLVSGKATELGTFDSQHDYEAIACRVNSSAVALPALDNFAINDGVSITASRTVTLTVQAALPPPGSVVKDVRFVEYRYSQSEGQWVAAKRSSWLPYTTTPMTTSWELQSGAGVKYMQAWARDAVGNLALLPYQAFINYVPATAVLAQGEGHVYRYTMHAGERFTAQVHSLNGDADLIVWTPDAETQPFVSNLASGNDLVSLVAPEDGTYQVEVVGATAAEYRLTVTASESEIATAQRVGGVDQDKPLPSQPLVPLDSSPDVSQELPVLPDAQYMLYMPVVRH